MSLVHVLTIKVVVTTFMCLSLLATASITIALAVVGLRAPRS